MKNYQKFSLILIILLSFSISNIYSQNREAIQSMFNLNGDSIYINSNLEAFKINNFILGWHWGDQYKISQALKMNQKDIASYENNDSINTNTNLFIRSSKNINNIDYAFFSHAEYDNSPVFTKSLKYDPTLYIDTGNVYKLNKRNGDSSNPVFGFLNKKGRVLTNSNDINYSRLIIDDTTLKNNVILSEPWPSSLMYYPKVKTVDSLISTDFAGRSFYLSINLRRFLNSTVSDDTPVLKLKVPYISWRDSSYNKYDTTTVKVKVIVGIDTTYRDSITNIKTTELFQRVRIFRNAEFDNIPSITNNDTTILANNYGTIWNLMPFGPGSNKPTEIIITRKMLPLNNGDITISGYLNFAGRVIVNQNIVGNHKLKSLPNYNRELDVIDSLKIEVTYLDTMQVAIDWVKFETPNARKLFHGQYDDKLAESIQGDLDFFTQSRYADNNVKPKRWVVHIEGNAINWEGERHFRKIVGDVTTGAVGASLSSHWDEFLGNADKWVETSAINSKIAAPYIAKNRDIETKTTYQGDTVINTNLWKTFGLQQGYLERYYNDPLRSLNRFNSGYETFLRHDYDGVTEVRNLSLNQYITNPGYVVNHGGNMSFQTFYEWGLYNNYINPYYSGYVFSDKPWFGQTFVQEFFHPAFIYENNTKDSSIHILEDLRRTHTGEEINLFMWNMLIMGAKGLIYDGGFDYTSDTNLRGGQTKIVPNEIVLIDSSRFNTTKTNLFNMDNYTFLNSPYSTGDFLEDRYEHIPIKSRMYISSKPEMLDTIAKYYGQLDSNGIPLKERIYIGKRSIRNKMFQTHNWVRANELELMNLKLMSWYGKGYKIWEKNHPSVDSNYFSKFILKDFIGTRKIYVADSINGNRINKQTNSYIDSGSTYSDFVDVTILKDKSKTVDSVFYVGVQNRRTDPTIYFTEDSNDKHFLFLSSSEFEDLCKNGGKNPLRPTGPTYADTTWQKYWWKRLGAREITVPFDYVGSNTNNYNLLKIEELQGEYKDSNGVISDNNLPFHLRAKYNQKIDTVMGQDGKLVLNLLPGQGKILKVSILQPDLSVTGQLAHPNQSKLVAYPILNSSGQETDSIQYHLVYFRKDIILNQNNYFKVYYRRSRPISKNNANENIVWNQEILLSNNIRSKDNTEIILNDTTGSLFYDCDYPSIVVRKDGNLLKAYITYACDNNEEFGNIIALSVLNVSNPVNVVIQSNRLFEKYIGENRAEFGTPVINASYSRNYLAWADYISGIKVATFTPDEFIYSDSLILSKNIFGNNQNTIANHPSLNTYSRLNSEEDNCALVWQQTNISNTTSNIIYTRLRVKNNNLENYSSSTSYPGFNSRDGNYYCINPQFQHNKFNTYPTVYRRLSDYNDPNRLTTDYIYWQWVNGNYISSVIHGNHISFLDYGDSTYNAIKSLQFRILDFTKDIDGNIKYSFSPNVSQQTGLNIDLTNNKFPFGNHILNFVRTSESNNSIYNTYQLNLFSSIFTSNNILNGQFKNKVKLITRNAKQPHLALYKEQNFVDNVWRNRRVYEDYNQSTQKIMSSGKYFYKNNENEELESEEFIGFHKGNKKYQINNPILDNEIISLILPFKENLDTNAIDKFELNINQDTIYSNWFQVNNVANFNFKCFGTNDTLVKMLIQKQSNNTFINLNIPNNTTDSSGKLGEFIFINGLNDNYRLCLIRNDTTANYYETMIINGLPIVDTVSLKTSSSNSNIVDLSGILNVNKSDKHFDLFINPNPADDVVYITPLLKDLKNQNSIEIEIFDNLGNLITNFRLKSGETKMFETMNLSQGVYVVNCKEITDDWSIPNIINISKFIINR